MDTIAAEIHRRRTRMTLRIWEHDCCGDIHWSAMPRCDRCGESSSTLVSNLSVAEAMAGHPLLPLQIPQPRPHRPVAATSPATEGESKARSRGDSHTDDHAAASTLFWLGVVASFALGSCAFIASSQGNETGTIALAIAAGTTPLAVLCGVIDGRLSRLLGRLFRHPW